VKWRGLYDAWGRLFKEILPTGAVLERELDKAGYVTRETTYDRDGAGAAKLEESRMVVNAFGAAEEIRELLRPSNGTEPDLVRLTRRTFDTNGRVVAEESGEEGEALRTEAVVEYENGTGRVARQKDALGNETVFTYEQAANWPTKVTKKETFPGSPSLIETAWTRAFRDALGRVIRQVHRDGQTLDTTYDQAGNVVATRTGTGVTTAVARASTVTTGTAGSWRGGPSRARVCLRPIPSTRTTSRRVASSA
jgi:YD repeat-containing protein